MNNLVMMLETVLMKWEGEGPEPKWVSPLYRSRGNLLGEKTENSSVPVAKFLNWLMMWWKNILLIAVFSPILRKVFSQALWGRDSGVMREKTTWNNCLGSCQANWLNKCKCWKAVLSQFWDCGHEMRAKVVGSGVWCSQQYQQCEHWWREDTKLDSQGSGFTRQVHSTLKRRASRDFRVLAN